MIAAAGFWAVHGFHVALVIIPATVMGIALTVEHRRTEARSRAELTRVDELRSSLGAGLGEWRGISRPAPAHEAGQVRGVPIAAAASVGAALVHLVVMPQHFAVSVLYGLFFLGAASVQIAWAWVATNRPSRLLLAAGAVGSAMVILLWLATRTVGIPLGPDATSVESVGALDSLATGLELVVVVAATASIRALPQSGVGACHHPRSWPAQVKGMAVCMVAAVAAVAFVAPVS